ncbi:MAG TPA: sigma-70 family RNA polymerase sigma factor, partial [Candidatus Limnocylindria bacterium]|nr:sigma-70 family RNA polymerase sigma factor [Candidatus Limnocylindria bacterium]
MTSPALTAPSHAELDDLLASFVTGLRAETLRAQLAAKHHERTREEIEDAIQTACKCFLDETDGITDPAKVYRWIRTAAHRALNRERDHLERQVVVDPFSVRFEEVVTDEPTPERQVIAREDEIDLSALTDAVAAQLPERQRNVLALWGADLNRPEIAERLHVRERVVKRDLLDIFERARAALSRLAGGGCEAGESLVVRLACGLGDPVEMAHAQLHLTRCPRCQQLHERLNLWREKVGAALPAPAAEHADLGLIERTLHKSFDTLGAVRQYLVDGGAQVKQQAAVTYYRAADPTPLAGARPGAVVAVVAGCLAIGTGTYTCVEQGVNPLTAIPGFDRQAPEPRAEAPPAEKATPDATPVETQP